MNFFRQDEENPVTIYTMKKELPNKFDNDDEWIDLNLQDITRIFGSLQKLNIIKKIPYDVILVLDEGVDQYNRQSHWEFKMA